MISTIDTYLCCYRSFFFFISVKKNNYNADTSKRGSSIEATIGVASGSGSTIEATIGVASGSVARSAMKGVDSERETRTENVSSECGSMGATSQVTLVDDGINYVDEDSYIMKIRDKMYSEYDALLVSTICQAPVLYRNDYFYDWLSDAAGVAFIELHGHSNFGPSMEKCMNCNRVKKKGSAPPSIQHSKECPFNNFIFNEPVIENNVPIVYFYCKKTKKKTKNVEQFADCVVEKADSRKKNK